MKRTDFPGGAALYEGPKGSLYLQTGAPGVIEGKYWGEHGIESFLVVSKTIQEALTVWPKVSLFVDLSEMTNFNADFRNEWVKWFSTHRPLLDRTVFLQNSVLVRVGLSIVNIALGGIIESHSDPAEYERAARAAGLEKIEFRCSPAA